MLTLKLPRKLFLLPVGACLTLNLILAQTLTQTVIELNLEMSSSRQNKAEMELGWTSEQTVCAANLESESMGQNKQTLMSLEKSDVEVNHSGELLQWPPTHWLKRLKQGPTRNQEDLEENHQHSQEDSPSRP